ncbi:MAG: hypothetical protein ABL963_16605, partial [Longimicrobiales bacterium]
MIAAIAILGSPIEGQGVVRVPATVDYVGTDGLYLTVGGEQGAARGDTLDVFADSLATESIARVLLTSVTRRRSVARVLAGSERLTLGATLFIPLTTPEVATAPVSTSPSAPTASQPVRPQPDGGGPLLAGRLALDFDARETRTQWTGDLAGEARRRFATPTTRLSFQASRLPGGVVLRANLRASYRYDELIAGPPPLSLRAYELSATKSFRAPLVVMLGRFANPYERFSAYWDGVLVRVGRDSGVGVGAVAGYEPERHDEGFATTLPKVTGFVDYSGGGRTWRYDTDLSLHFLRPAGAPDRSYAGWSQRISLGAFDLSQRIRVEGGLDGRAWSLSDVRLRVGLDAFGPVRVRGTYGRARAASALPVGGSATPGALVGPTREEASVGLDIDGKRGVASLDAARTRRDDAAAGWSISSILGLKVADGGLSVSGQRWWRGDAESFSLSPAVDATISGLDGHLGYRFYRTDAGRGIVTSHTALLQVGVDLSQVLHLSLRGERQWGPQLSGNALRLSVWRS